MSLQFFFALVTRNASMREVEAAYEREAIEKAAAGVQFRQHPSKLMAIQRR